MVRSMATSAARRTDRSKNEQPSTEENVMNISPRTKTLLDRLPNHPLAPAMRTAMIDALAAGEAFADYKNTLAKDGRMTELGKQQALREVLTTTFGKQLAKAKAPIAKARAEIQSRHAALTVKAVDPSNLAAALERQEIRQWVRSLDIGVRQSVVLATKDVRILDALLSAPPELSGIANPKAASEIEDRYIELTYPSELAAIETLDSVVAEAETAVAIARNEMRSLVDMHAHDFDELMRPVETHRPWLTSDRKQVVEIDAAGKASYRPANETDLANGVQYKDLADFQAAQGLAA
jgi:uncharacterized coiled-coil protein SlyX